MVEALEAKASARDGKLIEALEKKAGTRESKLLQELGRLSKRHVAISAGVGALVVLAVSLAPYLVRATPPPAQHFFIVARAEGGPALWVEAESYFAMSFWGEKRPLDQEVPKQTLPRQKVAPCDEGLRHEAIYGNCWARMDGAPPCGRLFRHGDKCYAPVAVAPWPVEPGPDR